MQRMSTTLYNAKLGTVDLAALVANYLTIPCGSSWPIVKMWAGVSRFASLKVSGCSQLAEKYVLSWRNRNAREIEC